MSANPSFEGKRVFVTFDALTMHWLNGLATEQSLDRATRTCFENWRTLAGLPHTLYQRVIVQAAAQLTPFPLFVSELLTRAAQELPPVPVALLPTVRTPIDEVEHDRNPKKLQVAVRFDSQQFGHLQRVAQQQFTLINTVALVWVGNWRTLGGAVGRPAYQKLVYTAAQRRIPLTALVCDLLTTQAGRLPASPADVNTPTPIDVLSKEELLELDRYQLTRAARPLPVVTPPKKKRRPAK